MTPVNLDAFFDDKFLKGLQASMAKWAVPGVSIALTHGNDHRVICLGERDTGLPMTPRTRMPLASNSKLVTVLSTAQALKLKGFPLGLKTRVKDVHPAFELKNKVIEAEATFEDVFSHRLRLPANNYHLSRPLQGETVCVRLSHVDPLEGYDDNQTSYSNFNYDLAVEIIESITNRSYEEFVSQAILAPLSMHDSSYSSVPSPDAPMAAGWHKIVTAEGYAPGLFRLDHQLDKMGARVGMGGIRFISTAGDMCSYLKALPANEAYHNACQPRLTHLSRFGCRFPDSEIKYGLGVQIATSRGIPIIGHTGACSGFRSYVGRFPEQDIGLAVLTNSTNGEEVYALIQLHILGVILGEDLSHLETILDQERDAAMKRYIHHFAPVRGDPSGEELIGTYTSPAYGDWNFDHASNLPTRPECAAIPWLGAFYGSVRPVVTAIGGGKYEGCIEWKGPVVYSDGEGETVERVSYGMPFVAEVKGDELRVCHFHEAGGPRSVNDPVLVFHKKK